MAPSAFHLTAFSFLLLLLVHGVAPEETENEKEFSYDDNSETGPMHWGDLHPEWAACGGAGQRQSPIDLSDDRVAVNPSLGKLQRSYKPAHAVMKNRGHDIMLQFEENAGFVLIDGIQYDLKQLHWHSPTEHSINGERYSLELHMVHQSADGKIAVVGILYTIGRPDSFLASLEEHIKKVTDMPPEASEAVGIVNPRDVKRGSRKYYRYLGSLTTPPCTEGVLWTVVKKVRTASAPQVALLRDAVHDGSEMNARPIQPTHDREIGLYSPKILFP